MLIRWHGHSCFTIESAGKTLLTDPFDASVGYDIPKIEPDIVTESHQHFDHNAHNLLKGNFNLISETGHFFVEGFKINGFLTYHDEFKGKKRGTNIIYEIITPDDFRIVHLGDLGEPLSRELEQKLMRPDILMIPVGGVYTIGSKDAYNLANELNPSIVIPMHFKTKKLKFELKGPENFTSKFENVENMKVLNLNSRKEVENLHLKVIVLDYE